MYGNKLLWTGLTLIVSSQVITLPIPAVTTVGAVIMVIGLLVLWVGK